MEPIDRPRPIERNNSWTKFNLPTNVPTINPIPIHTSGNPIFSFIISFSPFGGVCGHHIVAVALNFLANLR